MAGARGLVVIENQSAETEGTMWSMSSNGDDRDVSIPVIGIHEEDGQEILNMLNRVGEEKDHEEIRKLLKQRENVLAEISFDVPDPESNILLDVLLDPSERSTGFLLTSVHLRELMDVFDDLVITTRHFMYDGAEFGCTKTPRNDECTTQCTNNGRYCAVVPYDAAGQGVHGADVVAEILRRDCIQNNYDAVSKTWYVQNRAFLCQESRPLIHSLKYHAHLTRITYVEAFHRTCISETRNFQDFSSPSCIDKALKHANVDKKVVDTCMSSSGSISSNQANTILENELGSMRPSASMVGQISLNNRYVTSRIHSFDSLFDAICAAYATGYEHPVCLKCTDFDSKLFGSRYDCVMGSMIPKPQKRFAGFVAFCLVIGLITLQFVYTRWKIQKIVTQELKRYNLIPSFDEENRFHDNSIELVESTRNDSGEIFESPTPSLTYRGPRN